MNYEKEIKEANNKILDLERALHFWRGKLSAYLDLLKEGDKNDREPEME